MSDRLEQQYYDDLLGKGAGDPDFHKPAKQEVVGKDICGFKGKDFIHCDSCRCDEAYEYIKDRELERYNHD